MNGAKQISDDLHCGMKILIIYIGSGAHRVSELCCYTKLQAGVLERPQRIIGTL